MVSGFARRVMIVATCGALSAVGAPAVGAQDYASQQECYNKAADEHFRPAWEQHARAAHDVGAHSSPGGEPPWGQLQVYVQTWAALYPALFSFVAKFQHQCDGS